MLQPFWKSISWSLIKLNISSPYDPAFAFLDVYPKELKTYVHAENSIWMFTAALFIIAKTWKQPKCLSVGE